MISLLAERYQCHNELHCSSMSVLFRSRDLQNDYELPFIGYLIFNQADDMPVAAGFLRQAEGRIAFFDCFITNPFFQPSVRDLALKAISKNLMKIAKDDKFRKVLCFTPEESLFKRSLGLGFKEQSWLSSVSEEI
jgi:hypothetical protein